MFDSRDSTIISCLLKVLIEGKKEMTGRQLKFHLLFSPIESTSDRLSPPVYSTGIFCSSPLDPSTVSWRLATKSIEVFQNRLKPIIFFSQPTFRNNEKFRKRKNLSVNVSQHFPIRLNRKITQKGLFVGDGRA